MAATRLQRLLSLHTNPACQPQHTLVASNLLSFKEDSYKKTSQKNYFCNTDGLLLHGFVNCGLVVFANATKLINATNSAVSQNERTCLQLPFATILQLDQTSNTLAILLIRLNNFTLTAVQVSPALVLPIPVVTTERGITLATYFKNCDLPVPK